jgi:hypothetical protein
VKVKDPRRDNVTRRILELPEFEDMVKLGRVRDWFVCGCSSFFAIYTLTEFLFV